MGSRKTRWLMVKNAQRTEFFDPLRRRTKGLSFAKSEIARQAEAIDLMRGFEERVVQSHDQLGRMICRSPLQRVPMLPKKPVHLQHFAKSLDELHSITIF
jgi:hypothetical protein